MADQTILKDCLIDTYVALSTPVSYSWTVTLKVIPMGLRRWESKSAKDHIRVANVERGNYPTNKLYIKNRGKGKGNLSSWSA